MKRLLSTAMILSLLLSQVLIAQAADSAKASTLRLERTKGTVSLTNQSEKPLSCLDGMKLLSGYTLSTNAASYAYVSLDENKAVKLDGLSAATVKQKGKKLELLLSSGKLFFDVKVPLASDETMEIRTSTMVTGIRGTAGIAQVLSPTESTLLLLSGHVQTTSFDPVSGQIRTVQIQAGQLAHFTMHAGNPQPEVRIALAQISDIPGFAAVEIAGSPSLQTQIRNQTGLDLTALIAGAAKQLSADEAAQLERARLATTAIAAQTPLRTTTPLFPVSISNSGSINDRTPPPPPSQVTLTGSKTAAEIQAELDKSTIKTVILSGSSTSALEKELRVPDTKTLRLENNAILETTSTTPLTIEGTVTVQQSALLRNIGSPSDSVPGIIVKSTNSLDIAGRLQNDGLIQVGSLEMVNQVENITPGKLSILPGGSALNSGKIDIKKDSILESSASFESQGIITNTGTIAYKNGLFLIRPLDSTSTGSFPPISMNYENGNSNYTMYGNTLSDILQNAPTDATLTVLKPIDKTQIGSNPSLSSGKKLTLNLGVQTIDLDKSQLVNAGELTLNGDKNNTIKHLTGQCANAMIKNSGTLILNDCNIENSGSGSVIDSHMNPTASLSVTGNSKVTGSASSGVITVSAGKFAIASDAAQDKVVVIKNTNQQADSYALTLGSGVTATMSGGVITSKSGGVLLAGGANFKLEDGTIEGGTCGVVVSDGSPNKPTLFTMTNGVIGNETSTRQGVSLGNTNCVFTMLGGTIQTWCKEDGVYALNNISINSFLYTEGIIRAKEQTAVCPSPNTPYSVEYDNNNDYYYLQKN